MKLHIAFLAFVGSIHCYADLVQYSLPFVQDVADYSLYEESPPNETPPPPDETPDSPCLVDFDKMAQDFVLETKRIHIPGHPFAFNPSIVRWKGALLMSFRTYNPQTRSTNPFGFIWLDENFNPIGIPQLFELPFKNPVLMSKQQDPRLVTVGDRLFVVYNNILEHVTHREMRRMFIVEMQHDGNAFVASEPECLLHYEGGSDMRYEKNWVPFDYNNELLLSYSIIPHQVFRPVLGTNSCETLFTTHNSFPWGWGVPRGGTQAILDGDHYIAFFHSWENIPSAQSAGKSITHYVMGAYTFDAKPPFSLISASPEPIVAKDFYQPPYYRTWKPLRCVFPAGIVLDQNHIWVAYGRQDHEVWITKIDKKGLLSSLASVSQGKK